MLMHQKLSVLYIIAFVCSALLSCAVTGSQDLNLYESHPGIFLKSYSTAEQEAIEIGFTADPTRYTQDYAHMILWRIHIKNRDFSRQLSQLPDLNDGICTAEARALSAIYDYIHDVIFTKRSGTDHPQSARITMINDMISDGITNDRHRYSPSLEAFLWLILDGNFDPLFFSSQYSDSLTLTTDIWETMSGPRWQNYDLVLNRLNTPELIHYYINKKFRFRQGPTRGAFMLFKTNEGQSVDVAYFARQAMKRAGYRTFIRSVRVDDINGRKFHTGSGVIVSDDRYLLVADFNGTNRISGPHCNLSDVDYALAGGRKIIDSVWGVYDQLQ